MTNAWTTSVRTSATTTAAIVSRTRTRAGDQREPPTGPLGSGGGSAGVAWSAASARRAPSKLTRRSLRCPRSVTPVDSACGERVALLADLGSLAAQRAEVVE